MLRHSRWWRRKMQIAFCNLLRDRIFFEQRKVEVDPDCVEDCATNPAQRATNTAFRAISRSAAALLILSNPSYSSSCLESSESLPRRTLLVQMR